MSSNTKFYVLLLQHLPIQFMPRVAVINVLRNLMSALSAATYCPIDPFCYMTQHRAMTVTSKIINIICFIIITILSISFANTHTHTDNHKWHGHNDKPHSLKFAPTSMP